MFLEGRPDRCREIPEPDNASLASAISGWYQAALLDTLSLRSSPSISLKGRKF